MLSRELLLKLPHQPEMTEFRDMDPESEFRTSMQVKVPGLDLLEGLELRDRDKDYDGLLTSGALHLF